MLNISKKTYNEFKEKKEKDKKEFNVQKITIFAIVLLLLIAFLVIILLIINTKNKLIKNSENLPSYAQNFNKIKYNDTVEYVRDKGEMRRMKIYLGDFFDNIENKNYDEIYSRLDDSFKEKFFPRKQVLIDYINGEFPKDVGYVIKNFERIGSLYVYIVDIGSISDSRKKTDMKFVFEEYDLNDYRFSFSKI